MYHPIKRSNSLSSDNFICQFSENDGTPHSGEVVVRSKTSGKIVYEGELFYFQKEGYGIDYNQNGQIQYQGEFRSGKRDGWGKTVDYEGEFRENNYDGWGKLFSSSIYYEGYFLAGRFNGNGFYIQAKGEFKNMEDLKKRVRSGYLANQMSQDINKLFLNYNIEQIYLGNWQRGLKSGSGKVWKQNGYWYSGQFAYDTIHGQGAKFSGNPDQGVKKGYFDKGELK